MELRISISYPNPPTFVSFPKKNKKDQKVYISANALYSGIHFKVRERVIDQMKLFLLQNANQIPFFEKPIHIHYKYASKRSTWDTSNKLYIWDKVFCDMIKPESKQGKLGRIKEDSVEYVKSVFYEGVVDKSLQEDRLTITIYEYDD